MAIPRTLSLFFLLLASSQFPAQGAQDGGGPTRMDAVTGEELVAPDASRRRTAVLEGRVRMPDGDAAEGAVVVTDAGGKAITDERGRFRLELALSVDSLRVTAVLGSGSSALVASAAVPVQGASPWARVETLQLEAGTECQPDWLPTFGSQPGVDGNVNALAIFDDGSGAALYVGGEFLSAGNVGAKHVAKWDGVKWSALGGGIGGFYPTVHALVVFDDGSGAGPALYVGGWFTSAGGVPANRIARWDGASWSALGSGVDHRVRALAVFDDGLGGGDALFAGGEFAHAGGVAASGIARWDGASWSALGSGISNGPLDRVDALAVCDVGSGPELFVAGTFNHAGGVAARNVASWDGTSWSALGSRISDDPGIAEVNALVGYDPAGGGEALYAAGSFATAGGLSADNVARWDGTSWSALGAGTNGLAFALAVFDDGTGGGPALYAGGWFTVAGGSPASRIAKWDGSSWSALGSGVDNPVYALAAASAGPGSLLYAGGWFGEAGGVEVRQVAGWDGSAWSALGGGNNSIGGSIRAIAAFDDGSGEGPALYVGGGFQNAGGVPASNVARWNGATWSALGSGVSSVVFALAVYDDGGGPALYAGGDFTQAGGVPAIRVAKWDGTSWSPLGGGITGGARVHALTVFDDGGGPALYVAGDFDEAGGVDAREIAKWDGTSWSPLGNGMNEAVVCLTAFDDGRGGGPALYAGGWFQSPASNIARWNGTNWSALGSGVNASVDALAVFDDGSGPALYAGGRFNTAGGVQAKRIARWDGASWSPVGSGIGGDWVYALATYEAIPGSGPALYVGGDFQAAGGSAARYVASWDGTTWSPLGDGLNNDVQALGVFDDGQRSDLMVGGIFTLSPGGDRYLARWGGCTGVDLGFAYCFGDGSGTLCPCGNTGGPGEGCANSGGVGGTLDAAGSKSVSADDLTLQAAQLRPNHPALLFVGENAVNGGDGGVFGDGLRCAAGDVRRLGIVAPDSAGNASWGPGLSQPGEFAPGATERFQVWYRDATGSPCASNFNLSNGYEITFAT